MVWLGTLFGTPSSMWVINKYGMRNSAIVYCIIATFASSLNLLINVNYYYSFIGGVLNGVATPFLVSTVNKIGAVWFFPKDIPSVTMFIMFFWFNPAGISTLIPVYYFKINDHDYDDVALGRSLLWNVYLIFFFI